MRFFRLYSELDAKHLCNALDELDAIAIRKDFVKSSEELRLASYLAEKAIKNKKNIGKQLRYEFLLYLAGKTDIKSAMKLTTPSSDEREILLVVFSNANESGIKKQLKAKSLKLNLAKDADPLDLERISISRVK